MQISRRRKQRPARLPSKGCYTSGNKAAKTAQRESLNSIAGAGDSACDPGDLAPPAGAGDSCTDLSSFAAPDSSLNPKP